MLLSARNKKITVIDIGSSKIAAARAEINKNGGVSVIALENVQSRGIAGGDVVDLGKVAEDISFVIKKIERGRKIKNIFLTISGPDIKMEISRGMIFLSKSAREITRKDVRKALEMASAINLPLDRLVVEKEVKGFYVDDGEPCIKDPVGLYGIKLESDAFIVTTGRSKIQNLTKCIDHAGLLLDGIYLSIKASAESVLEETEKEEGVILIDVGGHNTSQLIYKDGMIKSFSISRKGVSGMLNKDNMVDAEKLEKFFETIFSDFKKKEEYVSSAVLIGGGALLDGMIEGVGKILKIPARIGLARMPGFNLNSQDAIIHSSTLGFLRRFAREYVASNKQKNPFYKAFRKLLDIYESYF